MCKTAGFSLGVLPGWSDTGASVHVQQHLAQMFAALSDRQFFPFVGAREQDLLISLAASTRVLRDAPPLPPTGGGLASSSVSNDRACASFWAHMRQDLLELGHGASLDQLLSTLLTAETQAHSNAPVRSVVTTTVMQFIASLAADDAAPLACAVAPPSEPASCDSPDELLRALLGAPVEHFSAHLVEVRAYRFSLSSFCHLDACSFPHTFPHSRILSE